MPWDDHALSSRIRHARPERATIAEPQDIWPGIAPARRAIAEDEERHPEHD